MGGKGITRLWYPRKEGFLGGVVIFLCVPQRSSASLAVYIVCAFTAETRRTAEERRGCGKLRHYCFLLFLFGQSRNRHRAFFLVPRDLEREHRALVGCR